MNINNRRPKITGDSYRDYRKYLEIQKMNNPSSSTTTTALDNISNANDNLNNNNILANNLQTRAISPLQYNQNSNVNRLSRPQSTSNIYSNINNYNAQNNIEQQSSLKNIANMTLPAIKSKNINNMNNINNDSLYTISNTNNNKDIDNLKMLLSKCLQNQNEMKNQIIEYNKIISSQENIIRINNLKLNEHDNKLTEILLSFNNFLQYNEKTGSIISDIQKNIETFVKIDEFTNLKNNIYSLIKNNENKINDINNNIEDIKLNINENKKENDTYQKYSLEKITSIQTEFLNNKLEQQNELLKFEDTRNESVKMQINQIKNQIKLNENNIKDEIDKRKEMVNELREEILSIFNKNDEKFANLEKSQLINEDNMMKLNKEFVQSLNDLINKSNQKHDYEIKTIRALIEASVQKNEKNLEKMIGDEKEKIDILEKNLREININFNDLDKYAKDSITGIEEKYEIFKDENNNYKTKLELINDTLRKFMDENTNVLLLKIKNAEDNLNKLLNEESKKNYEKIKNINDFTEKHIKDINEKVNDLSNQIFKLLENNNINKNPKDNILNDGNSTNLILIKEIIYNTCNEILEPVKLNFNDYNHELRNELIEKIENNKKLYSLEQIDSMKKIENIIEKKVALVKNDLEGDINTVKTMIDGVIMNYMVESETRIKEIYNKDIEEIKKEINEINTKLIAGM